jgi:subtilase family serine protease
LKTKTVDLNKVKLSIYPIFLIPLLALFLVNPASASSFPRSPNVPVLHKASVNAQVSLLASSFSPNGLVGGVPFCPSGSLGTILCYPPSFLKKAYNFPASSGKGSLDGSGSTIVIVDAFGSPTAQSDLNTYDAAFGLPATTVTILCGPTWTGAVTDNCPVKTIADLSTAPNAALCGAFGWASETTLDLSQAHSLAPGANIVLVVSNDCFDSNIYTAEAAVVGQSKYDGSIMSQSFGEPDDLVTCTALDPTGSFCISFDPTLLNQPNAVFSMATARHWTIIASSGDDGANEDARVLGTGELTPSFPATSPLVLAAGGTQGNPYGGQYGTFPGKGVSLSCAAGATCNTGLVVINGGANGCGTSPRPGEPSSCFAVGYGGEGVWNEFDSFGGSVGRVSGGGASSLYERPSYQAASVHSVTTILGSTFKVTGRATPDVSFNSAAQGGVLAFLGFEGGVWGVFSGTSASSPAWAAIIALLNQAHGGPVGFLNSAIYKLGHAQVSAHFAGAFHDITNGQNSDLGSLASTFGFDGFAAAPGYDMATGWGTPNVSVFIQDIQTFTH